MKKLILGVVAVLAIAGVAGGVLWLATQGDDEPVVSEVTEKFYLSDEIGAQGEVKEITAQEYDELVAARKSFVVVLHMVVCPAEFPVTNSAKELAHNEKMVVYSMVEKEFAQTELAQKIKYLPSVAIIHEGELVDFLDAEADEDLSYYKTAAGLKEWTEKWVIWP